MQSLTKRIKNAGFTIVELLIVVVVIGILVGITSMAYNGIQKNAIDKSLISDIDGVEGEVTRYSVNNGGVMGPSVNWYSPGAANPNVQFSATNGNIIDVVADSAGYCIRVYNPRATNKDLASALTRGRSATDCTRLIASKSARGLAADNIALNSSNGSLPKRWVAVASSSDGVKAVAVPDSGYIYTTTNSGTTWTARTGPGSLAWKDVTLSTDGTKLVAVAENGGANAMYTSTDSGVTWTSRAVTDNWYRYVASSSDGSKVYALSGSHDSEGYMAVFLFASSDYGVTWNLKQNYVGLEDVSGLSTSSSGAVVAFTIKNDYIYTSTDYGTTATAQTLTGKKAWNGVSVSSSGTKMIATEENGYIYTSATTGSSWIQRTNAGARPWQATISADGSWYLGVVDGEYPYISTNDGADWVGQTTLGKKQWTHPTISSNGLKLYMLEKSTTGSVYQGTYTP